jgi:hypothetical protein
MAPKRAIFHFAISGEYAIVGAQGEEENASRSGFMSAAGSANNIKREQGGTENWGQITHITYA